MEERELQLKARLELSDKRYRHTQGVVEAAGTLASRFGENVDKARRAAWIHDIAREWEVVKLQQYAEKIDLPAGFAVIPELLHGPVAAELAVEWFDLHDEEILNAVRYHTTGRLSMSGLEKVLCLADAIEQGRTYPRVVEIRQAAQVDLNLALAKSFDATFYYLLDRQQAIFPLSIMARNELWDEVRAAKSEARS